MHYTYVHILVDVLAFAIVNSTGLDLPWSFPNRLFWPHNFSRVRNLNNFAMNLISVFSAHAFVL